MTYTSLMRERDAYRKAKQENDERFQLEIAALREECTELRRERDKARQDVAATDEGKAQSFAQNGEWEAAAFYASMHLAGQVARVAAHFEQQERRRAARVRLGGF